MSRSADDGINNHAAMIVGGMLEKFSTHVSMLLRVCLEHSCVGASSGLSRNELYDRQ